MAIAERSVTVQTGLEAPTERGGAVRLRRSGRRAARPVGINLWVGAVLVGLVVMAALTASWLSPSPPDLVQPALRLQPPGAAHPFGTDAFGRDMLSRVLYGARIALQLSVFSVLLAALPGTLLGLIAGYWGGWLERVASRLIDIWLAFPGLLLAIVLVARLGASLTTTIVALGMMGVPWYYRLARTGTLSARHALHVEAAYSLGATPLRILFRHILPTLLSPVIVLSTLRLGTMLLAGGGLSFIGLGAQPPAPEWGALLASGREYMGSAWWLALFPGLAITLTVIGFNLLGDGLRDWLARA